MPSTPENVALVRLRTADTHEDPQKRLLTDEQLTALLAAHDGNTYRAAAEALRIIATSEVLVSKAIRTQDLQTSGDRVAQQLRLLAQDYDNKADEAELNEAGGLTIVPFDDGSGRLETEEHRRWY